MGMHSDYCVGCGPGVTGFYRPFLNWDLCEECYQNQLAHKAEETAEAAAEFERLEAAIGPRGPLAYGKLEAAPSK